MMKISIAMCTFNGADFLQQQLESFLVQTLLPSEIIICDDGSVDNSILIINNFRSSVPFPVLLTVNSQNIGSTKNFEKAISLCTGEVIALADQDDIWHPHKLHSIAEAFMQDFEVGMVFSDADIVDIDLNGLGYTLWQRLGFHQIKQKVVANGHGFELLLQKQFVTGATMAFRSSLRELMIPISPRWVHDGWISLLAGAVSRISIISEPLIMYRQHPGQQLGAAHKSMTHKIHYSREKDSTYFRELAYQYQDAFDRLEECVSVKDLDKKRRVQGKVQHLMTRANINDLRWARIPIILREFLNGDYHRYSGGLYSLAKDLLGIVYHR
jgi:glycosyltransferase involved in cell wall biosynthesis